MANALKWTIRAKGRVDLIKWIIRPAEDDRRKESMALTTPDETGDETAVDRKQANVLSKEDLSAVWTVLPKGGSESGIDLPSVVAEQDSK